MKRIFALLLAATAVLAALLAFSLSFTAVDAEAKLLFDPGDGSDTAAAFFDALCTGDYGRARELCPELPADAPPQDEDEAALHALLCEKRSWESAGAFVRNGTSSAGAVRFTYLDIHALTADMKPEINAVLARCVEEAARPGDVYDENGEYRDEVVQQAWDEVYAARLARADEFLVTEELAVELRCREREWEVLSSSELLRCLRGGV